MENPYESPREYGPRGPFWQRFLNGVRRARKAYSAEIDRSRISAWEHLAAWIAIGLLALIAFILTMVALFVFGEFLGATANW